MGTPRLLLVDDDAIVMESLKYLFQSNSDILLAGAVGDGDSAIIETRKLKPDIILMDVKMPTKSGIEATREIRLFDNEVKILIHSGYPNRAKEAIAAGADGFVAKPCPLTRLMSAIRAVLEGGAYLDRAILYHIKPRMVFHSPKKNNGLNKTESQIAPLLIQGLNSKQIADSLKVSRRKVDKIRHVMMIKLGANNAAALASRLTLRLLS